MVKVLIADDMKILRESIRMIIENDTEFQVVGCAKDGKEALEMSRTFNPDIVLMDLNMPAYSGIDAIKYIKEVNKNIKILVLTGDADEKSKERALENGADGYVSKDISPRELILAINNVLNVLGLVHKKSYSAGKLYSKKEKVKLEHQGNTTIENNIKFTNREQSVIKLVVEGMTNDEIARILGISEGRVRNIVASLISKCLVRNRTQLAVFAVQRFSI